MQRLLPLNHAPPRAAAGAWALRAWPPVLWQAGEARPVRFEHLGTLVSTAPQGPVGASGQTLWSAQADDGEAGMAWDWIEIHGGVIALADPLSVISNLRLIGDAGEVLTSLQAARFLNALVHALPWQQEVERALRGRPN